MEAGQKAVGAGLYAMRTTYGQEVNAKTFSIAGRGAQVAEGYAGRE